MTQTTTQTPAKMTDAQVDQYAGALLVPSADGTLRRWSGDGGSGPVRITYRIADAYPAYSQMLNDSADFRALPAELRAIATSALREIERLVNVVFVEDTTSRVEDVQIVVMGSRFSGGAGNPPGDAPHSGDVVIGIGDGTTLSASGSDVTGDGKFAGFRQVFVHELSHALGLSHPRDYDVVDGVLTGSSAGHLAAIAPELDTLLRTVMSYFGDASSGRYQWTQTLMPLDIAALQRLYGASAATAGDDVIAPPAVNPGLRTIHDVGGHDLLDLSAMLDPASVDLTPGGISSIGRVTGSTEWTGTLPPTRAINNVVIGQGTVIEDVVGTPFADTIVGNDAANHIDGGAGADTMAGGPGDDVYLSDRSDDVIVERAGEGVDTVLASAPVYELTEGASVEWLRALDPNSTMEQALRGNSGDQVIVGNAGRNVINGYGGNDTMVGLGGDDTYLVRGPGDRVVEENGGGWDTVYTTVSYNLGANEVEVLSTVVQADTAPIDLIGNYATQMVIGNYGANILNGGSGGDDTLIGLKGDDTYAVGSQSISIVEQAGEGYDTVVAGCDYRLAAGCSIEVLAAQNRDAPTGLRLTGNELDQLVAGTNAADTLDGGGGSDTLIGFGGRDLFTLRTGSATTIADFTPGEDRIGLAIDGLGTIGEKNFTVGTAATTADQRLIHDPSSGRIFWDPDGSGPAQAVVIGRIDPGAALSWQDIVPVPTMVHA